MNTQQRRYDVAAYIWPAYTGDEPRTRMFWPEGNGEWETVRKATAKFPVHQWPRRPLWGYGHEAAPRVMEMQIDAAADHGVNVFASTNIDSWNEWTETSYLQPDDLYGYGYLEAVRNVFGSCDRPGTVSKEEV